MFIDVDIDLHSAIRPSNYNFMFNRHRVINEMWNGHFTEADFPKVFETF